MERYVPIYERVRRHWVYQDSQYFHVWTEMLFCARFAREPGVEISRGEKCILKRGEFIFSRPTWSVRLGIPERRLRTLISRLLADDMIQPVDQHFRRYSVYRIVNFEKYALQNSRQKRCSNGTVEDSIDQQRVQQAKKSDQQTTNRTTTKVEGIYRKNNYSESFESFWSVYPRRVEKAGAFRLWNTRIKEGHTAEEMIAAAAAYASICSDRDPKFIKHPKTFLGPDKPFLDYARQEAEQGPARDFVN